MARAARELSPLDMQVLSLVYGLDGNVPMKRAVRHWLALVCCIAACAVCVDPWKEGAISYTS